MSRAPEADPLRTLPSEAASILARFNEAPDHLCPAEVTAELVQLIQPEVKAVEIVVWRVGRAAAQLADVLHEHETAREFLPRKALVLGHAHQRTRAREGSDLEAVDECVALGRRGRHPGVLEERVNVLRV